VFVSAPSQRTHLLQTISADVDWRWVVPLAQKLPKRFQKCETNELFEIFDKHLKVNKLVKLTGKSVKNLQKSRKTEKKKIDFKIAQNSQKFRKTCLKCQEVKVEKANRLFSWPYFECYFLIVLCQFLLDFACSCFLESTLKV